MYYSNHIQYIECYFSTLLTRCQAFTRHSLWIEFEKLGFFPPFFTGRANHQALRAALALAQVNHATLQGIFWAEFDTRHTIFTAIAAPARAEITWVIGLQASEDQARAKDRVDQ
jgi:hypothetical protein